MTPTQRAAIEKAAELFSRQALGISAWGMTEAHEMAEALRAALAEPAPVQEPVGPSGDKLSDFRTDQWWLPELDAAVASGTPDQKRAVAVVRNLLATKDVYLTQQPALPADVPMLAYQELVDAHPVLYGLGDDDIEFARNVEKLVRQKAGLK